MIIAVVAAAFIAAAIVLERRQSSGPGPLPRLGENFLPADIIAAEIKDADERLAKNPTDINMLVRKGALLFQYGPPEYVNSIKILERARDAGSLEPMIFYYLGVMYQYEGLFPYAEKEYQRLLANFPDDSETRLLLGKLYYRSGDYRKSAEQFELAAKTSGIKIIALENLALAYFKDGNKTAFEQTLSELADMGPRAALRADFCRASSLFEEKQYAQAAALLKKVYQAEGVRYDPTFDLIAINKMLALSFMELKDNGQALVHYAELSRLDPLDKKAASETTRLQRWKRLQEKSVRSPK